MPEQKESKLTTFMEKYVNFTTGMLNRPRSRWANRFNRFNFWMMVVFFGLFVIIFLYNRLSAFFAK